MVAGARSVLWRVLRGDIAELLLPQRCVACRGFGAALHPECTADLPRADGVRCRRCWALLRGRERPIEGLCGRCAEQPPESVVIEARRAAFRFEGAARLAVLEAKFRGITALLAPLADEATRAIDAAWEVEAVVAVPLHPSRRRARGFDQGALIARAVAARLAVPVRGDLIHRARRTRAQASLGREERARNVEGAFAPTAAAPGASAPPRRVLLVDDVMTTGATLEAAASALRAAGVASVLALTLAIED